VEAQAGSVRDEQAGPGAAGNIYVVEDDVSFSRAVERVLAGAGFQVVAFPSAQHLLEDLPRDSEPGCVLLDVRLPGLSGPELQEHLGNLGSTLPIIFLTGYPNTSIAVQAIKAGAEDFLTKPVASDELLRAVQRALAKHTLARDLKNSERMVRARMETLTAREREVFALIVRGQRHKQIAHSLGCAERTVKAHRRRVMEKMQVRSLAELVLAAERMGLPRTMQP
jgi:FixJ family two-component response regulator